MFVEKNDDVVNTSLQDIFSAMQRQMKWFLLVFISLFLLGGAFIYLLPNIYEAKADILIEQEAMFSRDGDTQVDQNITPRVHAIVKTVMTSRNIENILKKYNLVDASTEGQELHSEVARFREDTQLEFNNVEVLNPFTGKEGKVSIGFSVEYENESPELAYEVTTEITNLLLSANDGKVSTEEDQRLSFLKNELESVVSELKQQEKNLAAFKEKNQLYLPSLYSVAVSRNEQIKAKLLLVDDTLKILRDKERTILLELSKIESEQSLYTQDGKQVDGAAKRLAELESEYIEKSMAYTDSHPEIVWLKDEIRSLELQMGRASKRSSKSKSLTLSKNLEYVEMSARLDDAKADIAQELIRLKGLNNELLDVEGQIQKMPHVEQELLILERELERVDDRYKDLSSQYSQADLVRNMGQAKLFDRFVLVEPPEFPLKPVKPKKVIMAAVLFVLAMVLGLLTVLLREWFNSKITGQHIMKNMGYAPVFTIPRFE